MNTVQAQKENVDSTASSSNGANRLKKTAGQDNFWTPRRGFVVHDDSKSTGRKGLKERSSNKRRVLDDISNKQQGNQTSHIPGGSASAKKSTPGSDDLGKLKKREASKKVKTPLKTKGVTPLKSKTEVKPLRVEEAPEIELAYGGLSPLKSELAYSQDVHDEIVRDIINDTTPSLGDAFDAAPDIDDWSDERAMLQSGEPPSPWWSQEFEKDGLQEEKEEQYPALDDVPPPDDFSGSSPDAFDADKELLEDLLSVDVEACTG
uniref:Uncharacterized protein n=1 Tax=Peronospora matthiolae TaxID=2874970 RepID=A0AAV1TCI5_9STRA